MVSGTGLNQETFMINQNKLRFMKSDHESLKIVRELYYEGLIVNQD